MEHDAARLPLLDGLTQTQRDTEPLTIRLAEFLADQQGNVQEDINDGLDALERAFKKEPDDKMKSRIAAAIMILRDGPPTGG